MASVASGTGSVTVLGQENIDDWKCRMKCAAQLKLVVSGMVLATSVMLFSTVVSSQTKQAPNTKPPQVSRTRTANGHPDFSGTWSFATITPLERPSELASKQVLTEQEKAEFEKLDAQKQQEYRSGYGGRTAGVYGADW